MYDSLLSEYAVLGFEYGYSITEPEALVLWKQFGDFANGAQIIIDQFIVAAKDKWNQDCGLVMLLPHGYEGQGPEHSSARIERFLLLAAEDNIQVCNATTAAQFFHLVRRQSMMSPPAPLVIFTPKSLLRSKHSRSNVTDLMSGTFEELLGDVNPPPPLRSSGSCSFRKVAFDLMAERDKRGAKVAIARVEQFCRGPSPPLPPTRNLPECEKSSGSRRSRRTWVRGTRSRPAVRGSATTTSAGKPSRSGSPATGSAAVHAQELQFFDEASAEPMAESSTPTPSTTSSTASRAGSS